METTWGPLPQKLKSSALEMTWGPLPWKLEFWTLESSTLENIAGPFPSDIRVSPDLYIDWRGARYSTYVAL